MTNVAALELLTFPLSGVRLIEASAGTGKTYTIAALYVRLILGHDLIGTLQERPLIPQDILVVTFTEAATKELRERIRERLTQSARHFRQQTIASDDFVEAIRLSYEEDLWPSCARRLELAANLMDEAAIYTIHSWCNRMLEQHAFDSGSSFRQEVFTDDTELFNETVKDYWRSFFYPLSDTQTQVIYKLATSPEALAKLIRPLLNEAENLVLQAETDINQLLTAWEEWEIERCRLEDKARTFWSNNQSEIEPLLIQASSEGWLNGVKFNKATFQIRLTKMADWADGLIDLPIKEIEKFSIGYLSESLVNKHQDKLSVINHDAFDAISTLVEYTHSEVETNSPILLHAIHWVRERYHNEKLRLAKMTFDDMLTRLDNALHNSNGETLANIIRNQHPVAFIDEFQDTDPIQYRIFSRLYPPETNLESGFGCFLIGDPKQAIYSFRGADIYAYLKAHRTTQGRHRTLKTNYRSTTALVEAINQVFYQAEQQPEGAFRFNDNHYNPIPFIKVMAKGRKDGFVINNQPALALTIWHLDSTDAINLTEYRERMAEATASEIVRLLQSASLETTGFMVSGATTPLQPSDIAILVRNGKEAKSMRDALATRRLGSIYLSERDSIFASPEAIDLLFWLKALADPRNENKVRAALSTATFDWSYQTLHQQALDDTSWEQHLDRFFGYHQRWQQDGILPALRQLLNDYDLLARLKQRLDGERCITNLLHLAELLQRASSQFEGEQALIRFLAEAVADTGNHANDENVIRLESDANLIKIITIHKSKGLEYPLVFLPFICSFREINNRSLPYSRYHNENQELVIDLTKNDTTKIQSDKERQQEDLRLLYVAMTRAQYACWLGIAPIKVGNTKACQLEKSAIGYMLGWQAGMNSGELNAQLIKLKGDCPSIAIMPMPNAEFNVFNSPYQTTQLEPPRSTSNKISPNWWIASYSALQIAGHPIEKKETTLSVEEPEKPKDDKQYDEIEFKPIASLPAIDGVHSLPRGAEPGVQIHALLEQCAMLGFTEVHRNNLIRKELIQRHFQTKEWQDKQDVVAPALAHWLAMPLLENKDIYLAKLDSHSYQAEMEFLLGADFVDTQALDLMLTHSILSDLPRPKLLPGQVNGFLKGFIDLVFTYHQQYYVVDYKFNCLGDDDKAYTKEALSEAILTKRYDLQYALYLLALHRLLKSRMGKHYDYDIHIGGSLYLFLRGYNSTTAGRFFDKPPKQFIEKLDLLFSGSEIHYE